MHISETKIETEVKIVCKKRSPLKPMQRMKCRVREGIFEPTARPICLVKTEHS
jgi:hypothetical protein